MRRGNAAEQMERREEKRVSENRTWRADKEICIVAAGQSRPTKNPLGPWRPLTARLVASRVP